MMSEPPSEVVSNEKKGNSKTYLLGGIIAAGCIAAIFYLLTKDEAPDAQAAALISQVTGNSIPCFEENNRSARSAG